MIDCEKIVNEMKEDIKKRVNRVISHVNNEFRDRPGLAIIQVGNNPASTKYVNGKINDCKEVGIYTECYKYDTTTTEELMSLVSRLNFEDHIHGIILQLPVPENINVESVIKCIDESKDVDGFTHHSLFTPCTPKGVLTLLDKLGVEIEGKTITFVGYGNLVNKPLHALITDKGATCVVCRSHTDEKLMQTLCRLSDIVITAVGKHGLITKECIGNHDQIFIDCGIQVIVGKQFGDCDTEMYDLVENITPRIKGMGLLTRVSLLENVCEAAEDWFCIHS